VTAPATDNRIAETILAQLGGARALFMVGGRGNVARAGENSLIFDVKGSPAKVTCVRIALETDDTYSIDLFTGSKLRIKRASTTAGVQVAELRETLEMLIGLRLSLGTCGR